MLTAVLFTIARNGNHPSGCWWRHTSVVGLVSKSNIKCYYSISPQGLIQALGGWVLMIFRSHMTYKINLSKYARKHQLSAKGQVAGWKPSMNFPLMHMSPGLRQESPGPRETCQRMTRAGRGKDIVALGDHRQSRKPPDQRRASWRNCPSYPPHRSPSRTRCDNSSGCTIQDSTIYFYLLS